jgi:hypothetical protein
MVLPPTGPIPHRPSQGAAPAEEFLYRFGEVGVMMGLVTRKQVDEALKKQEEFRKQERNVLLGDVMVESGWLNKSQVTAILVAQRRYRRDNPQIALKLEAAAQAAAAASMPTAVLTRTNATTVRDVPALGAQASPAVAPAPPAVDGSVPAGAPAASPAVSHAPPSTAPPPKPYTPSGTRPLFGQFELVHRIGEGAMGALFQAQDTLTGRMTALKLLPKHLAADPEFVERFRREVAVLSSLDHPNIVRFFGSGEIQGQHYLAMEFIEGLSLGQRLRSEERIPQDECLRIVRDVAKALSHAHAKGVVHRDIKPDNILFAKDGTVKVVDFGLAKNRAEKSKLTAIGTSIGTPYYLSPEQAMGEQNVDARADLYGLGVTLFHLLTGQVPFDDKSSMQVMMKHVQAQPPDPRGLNPGISRGLSQVILKLMEKDPANRYASADELIAVLEKQMAYRPPSDDEPALVVSSVSQRRRRRLIGLLPRSCQARLAFWLVVCAAIAAWLRGG